MTRQGTALGFADKEFELAHPVQPSRVVRHTKQACLARSMVDSHIYSGNVHIRIIIIIIIIIMILIFACFKYSKNWLLNHHTTAASKLPDRPPHRHKLSPQPRVDSIEGSAEPWPQRHHPTSGHVLSGVARPTWPHMIALSGWISHSHEDQVGFWTMMKILENRLVYIFKSKLDTYIHIFNVNCQ